MKVGDILISVAVAVAAAVLIVFNLFDTKSGKTAVITVDGRLYGEYSLYEDKEIEIFGKNGYNKLKISDSEVKMTEADCPDGYCVSHVAINSVGETVVCLPHGIVVEIKE